MGTIRIIGAPEESDVGVKGGLTGNSSQSSSKATQVSTEVLQDNLNQLVTDLSGILDNIESQNAYKLKQFSVAVEVSEKGGVSLVGKLEAGAKAGINLVFERD